MSMLTKAILISLFATLVIVLFGLLPSTTDYPLPPEFATSLATIMGYTFAWASVFTCLYTLITVAVLGIAMEIAIFLWKVVSWIITFTSRFVA